ncbi:hypothetical protein Taro_016294 [Colocasia esculenta]|uniref:40S ribosomal protein S6 n=1 Tax=Colocasia esculenta TaxID=4460 RepID=A0A843UJX6_COLES|nr:hypothetical protein [Colocasia esculenta]
MEILPARPNPSLTDRLASIILHWHASIGGHVGGNTSPRRHCTGLLAGFASIILHWHASIGGHIGGDTSPGGTVLGFSLGCDKHGFPMKQGVLTTPGRVRVLLHRGTPCFRGYGWRNGERRHKSIRGCIASPDLSILNLVIVKKGDNDPPPAREQPAQQPACAVPLSASHPPATRALAAPGRPLSPLGATDWPRRPSPTAAPATGFTRTRDQSRHPLPVSRFPHCRLRRAQP